MKIGKLDLHCGECPIIEYCNEYEDTPPCQQPRFENIETEDYLIAAAIVTSFKTSDEMVDKIYEFIKEEDNK